jgi:predicted 3-demethylubiquinone-9 3-methyltransferase (glyoxalase superfamily)
MMRDEDPERSKRVMEAMMQMVKLDVAKLREAYEG